jgi:hypothetical protein
VRRIGISVGGAALLVGATLWTMRATDTPPTSRLVESGAPGSPAALAAAVPGEELLVRARDSVAGPVSSSDRAVRVTLHRMFGDSTSLARVNAILQVGNRLLVADTRTSPHVMAFDLSTGALVSSFARHGRGPGEVSSPRGLQRDPDNADLVWVYDFEQRRLVGVDVASSSAPLNRPIGEAGSLLTPMLRQGTIISNGLFQDYSLVVLDSLGKPIGRSDFGVPFAPPEVSSVTAQRLLNVSTLAYAPLSRSRLVLAYQFSARLDILDLETGVHRRVTGPIQSRASYRVDPESQRFFWNDDNQHAYWSVAADEETIFALYSGRQDNAPYADSLAARRVQVFDWHGAYCGTFVLDRPSDRIAVSEDGRWLFASIEEPWEAVGMYAIPRETVGCSEIAH